MKNNIIIIAIFLSCLSLTAQVNYDIVINGGRVMDPETGLDAIRNIGIIGSHIAEITKDEIIGKKTIDARGLIVSPGFIDLHVHGMTNKAHVYQVRDGVTTALELEAGRPFLQEWLVSKKGNSIVNYGASVPHGSIRAKAMGQYRHYFESAQEIIKEEGFESSKLVKLMMNMGRSGMQVLSEEDIERMNTMIDEELTAGALGIGVPVGYYLGASHGEILSVYKLAAERQVPIFSHTRGIGMSGIHEAIANATTTGAPLHIVHANSLSLGDIQVTLDMVAAAQANGLDITTEIYPYTAASTGLGSAIFNDGWQETLGISFGELQLESTGERLTEATFKIHRNAGATVIIHMMKPEWILKGIRDPRTMIASDGMPFAPGAHPRTAGTFTRVLGRYVREQKVISLMEALKKMTIMPANRMASIAPMMYQKGRLQVGVDADITIFNPETIIDKADFNGLRFSEGIKYVLINGVVVVNEGENVKDVFPGKAIVGMYRN